MSASFPLIGLAAALIVWAEWRWPLRQRLESVWLRSGRNVALGWLGALTVQLCELPLVYPLSVAVADHRSGLIGWLGLPPILAVPVGLLLMDYSLYLWHRLNHRAAFLWRFHVVHHLDRDMDASTAIRFHFGEHVLSVPWRAAQIALIGIGPSTLALWQTMLFLEIVFHHSNICLPVAIERRLSWLIVTPRLHGIHHSIIRDETDSNWSSGLTLWDRIHGTLRLDVPQQEIDIGVPAYREPNQLSLLSILTQPFRRQPSQWVLPDGSTPIRPGAGRVATELAP